MLVQNITKRQQKHIICSLSNIDLSLKFHDNSHFIESSNIIVSIKTWALFLLIVASTCISDLSCTFPGICLAFNTLKSLRQPMLAASAGGTSCCFFSVSLNMALKAFVFGQSLTQWSPPQRKQLCWHLASFLPSFGPSFFCGAFSLLSWCCDLSPFTPLPLPCWGLLILIWLRWFTLPKLHKRVHISENHRDVIHFALLQLSLCPRLESLHEVEQ